MNAFVEPSAVGFVVVVVVFVVAHFVIALVVSPERVIIVVLFRGMY